VVSFTFRPLYTRGKNPPYPLARTLGWPQRRHGSFRKAKNLVTLPGIEPTACSLSHLRPSAEIRILGLYHRTPASSWHRNNFILLYKPTLYNTGPTFSHLQHEPAPSFSLIRYCSDEQNSPLVQNPKYHGSVALLHLQVSHFNPAHLSS
jgi:hypothetical protein